MKERMLAYRYAKSFLAFAPREEGSESYAQGLYLFHLFLRGHRASVISCGAKELGRLCAVFNLPVQKLSHLIKLLDAHNRLRLFAKVIHALWELYRKRYEIAACTIKSSHDLTVDEEKILQAFVQRITGCQVFYRSVRVRSLIAGIRIESDEFLWEQSIADKLRRVEQLFY